jgi:hypothetical protein
LFSEAIHYWVARPLLIRLMKGQRHDDAEGSIRSPIYRNSFNGRLQRLPSHPCADASHLIGRGLLRFNQRSDGSNQSMLGHGERQRQLQPGRHLVSDLWYGHELRPLYCACFGAGIGF